MKKFFKILTNVMLVETVTPTEEVCESPRAPPLAPWNRSGNRRFAKLAHWPRGGSLADNPRTHSSDASRRPWPHTHRNPTVHRALLSPRHNHIKKMWGSVLQSRGEQVQRGTPECRVRAGSKCRQMVGPGRCGTHLCWASGLAPPSGCRRQPRKQLAATLPCRATAPGTRPGSSCGRARSTPGSSRVHTGTAPGRRGMHTSHTRTFRSASRLVV